ncbi:hypothetical protein [Arthrobacter bambusae]|uniref:DUF3558 domain-containing protein n=1 Tax=Arthrobacter bambusae TaxID=1338426 RepID=A0AAW8DA70_9MICC|nr:hypothetical protein [Arthrobacter bambusae]MDP9904703.1 hypothetical protein [Arthrobacter bambusae]MDQ0129519.1 hypothetical protein [Arthrobacter bambusae]MDQ0180868.1 hypothetical protein [Arthrobacter bambusae]
MTHELRSRPRLYDLRFAVALLCVAALLTACTPVTMENAMAGSKNPSDPATVKAQVEQLKQALRDVQVFQTETQKVIGPEKWTPFENPVNGGCRTKDGKAGVNYRVIMDTTETTDHDEAIKAVAAFWESKGFTTRTETNPSDPGVISLYADENGGHLLSFSANLKGSSLDMDSVCIPGDQTAIYKELYPENFGLPSNSGPSPTTK